MFSLLSDSKWWQSQYESLRSASGKRKGTFAFGVIIEVIKVARITSYIKGINNIYYIFLIRIWIPIAKNSPGQGIGGRMKHEQDETRKDHQSDFSANHLQNWIKIYTITWWEEYKGKRKRELGCQRTENELFVVVESANRETKNMNQWV